MSLHGLGTLSSLLIAGITLLAVYLGWLRLVRMELTVATIWDFQMRRSVSELIRRGLGEMQSPIIVNDEAKAWMRELAEALRAFYRRLGRNLTDRELALEIERHFGEEILHKVCIPHGLFEGACLLIAIEVAKEGAAEPSSEST